MRTENTVIWSIKSLILCSLVFALLSSPKKVNIPKYCAIEGSVSRKEGMRAAEIAGRELSF